MKAVTFCESGTDVMFPSGLLSPLDDKIENRLTHGTNLKNNQS